jgi:hypothetical protein
LEQLRRMVQQRRSKLADAADAAADFKLPDARLFVAKALGFESWDSLIASLATPATDPRIAFQGLSRRPPFYKIDWNAKRLEPRQPLAERDWDTIIGVIREHGITSVNAGGQITDAVLERLSHLGQIACLHLGGSKRLTWTQADCSPLSKVLPGGKAMYDMSNMKKLKKFGELAPAAWQGFVAFDKAAMADGQSQAKPRS